LGGIVELRQVVTSDGTVILTCTCGSEAFRIRFKKSKSVQLYEAYGATGHNPDTQVVECTSCGSEITITNSEPQMQRSNFVHAQGGYVSGYGSGGAFHVADDDSSWPDGKYDVHVKRVRTDEHGQIVFDMEVE
jgi:hypothetical protein